MGISQIIAGVSAFVTGLVPLSCQHKAPAPPAPVPAPAPVVAVATTTNSANSTANSNSPLHNLGELSLTNHCERNVSLGEGKECILLPNLVDKHNAEITVTYESKMPGGQIHDMIITQIDAKTGQPVDVTLGDLQLTLTPDILSE
jgi:hypothetical protein